MVHSLIVGRMWKYTSLIDSHILKTYTQWYMYFLSRTCMSEIKKSGISSLYLA